MQWLVTGCSSGLGLELARAILASGQKCIATSRNPSASHELVAEIEGLGGVWAQLDVASPLLEQQFQAIVGKYGDVDVLVNNAGYAMGSVIEAMNLDDARANYETNFFGPIRLIQAVLPAMRQRGTGVILNISSSEFFYAHPVASLYASTKFALEGISEGLATEVSDFGIRVLLAEPGAMRTSFVDPKRLEAQMTPVPEAYKNTTADYVIKAILSSHGSQELDAKKSAEALVREVLDPSADKPIFRMALGKESSDKMKAKANGLIEEWERGRQVALSCDY